MKKLLCALFVALMILNANSAFALSNPFSKKSKQEAEKMVQTKQEWEQKAQNVNIEDRSAPKYQRPEDKDFKPKTPPAKRFVKYNKAPGSREIDISKIKKEKDMKSQGVIDPDFRYMAYGQYYYAPMYDQISSEIFVQKLKSGTRMNKALNTSIINIPRILAIESGTREFKRNLFSTLTIVDFSKDSKKLLVKEKVGSSVTGIYRSYAWVYFMQGEETEWFAIKFSNLNSEIKKYHAQKSRLALDNYMWDIKPLGFSNENPDMIIVEAFAWEKDKKQRFLGTWGVNCSDATVTLLSPTPMAYEISINGVIVQEYLP